MKNSKLTRRQMLGYLSLMEACEGRTSIGMADIMAREQRRLPRQDDHETVLLATELAMEQGLVSGSAAKARGNVTVYLDLSLTEKGRIRLYRMHHRFWWLLVAYEEIKDFAATVAGKALGP
jgi:hypothetical protein